LLKVDNNFTISTKSMITMKTIIILYIENAFVSFPIPRPIKIRE